VIAIVNAAFVVLLYKELKLSTFDAALATALGMRPGLIGYALLGLVSITAVGAFDAVGAILFVAFVIVPPTAAYLLTDRLWRMLVYGCLIAIGSSLGGYAFALAYDVSIGGAMASATGLFLLLALLLGRHGLLARGLRRRAPTAPPHAAHPEAPESGLR
jgi:manganese/zinc/iron transport system permease protein